MRQMSWMALVSLCVLGVASTAEAAPIQLITNGGFETGGGSFTGWTVTNQAGGSGNWFIQTGTTSPTSGFPVPAPPGPTHAAMTDQGGPGSHVLIQSFVVPVGVTSATFSFDRFIGNRAGTFSSPSSLNFNTNPNQQARVDILTGSATPFSVAASDILLNIFQTQPGDPATSGYTTQSTNLAAFLAAHSGETLQLRFAETDNQFFFNFGVDNVSLLATSAVPEPTTLAVFGLMGAAGFGYVRRRLKGAPVAA